MSEPETDDSKIQNLLQGIREKSSQGAYIYRGEAEQHEKIASGLYRKYKDEIQAKEFDIQIAQKEMLEQVKAYTDFTDETDVLTELQHYGGKTNLIDFTTDYLIALFFACDGSLNKDKDGRVILLNKNSNQGTISSPKKNQNNRVISQKSIFFQSPKGYLDEKDYAVIPIPKEMKQPLLDYLRKYHGISTHTIYNDLFGYIQNQEKHQPAYAEFYIGLTFQKKGEYEEAIEHYSEAIRINPQDATAYNNRGTAKGELGRPEEAIADFNEAIRINPQYALPYNNRGTAKLALGWHHDAIADCDRAIHINPQYADAYYNRGTAKVALGRHEEAITDHNEAIRINPQHAAAYANRGTAKDALGRYYEAIADYDEAIRINPQYAVAYYNRGNAKVALGRHEDAIADYNQAIHLNPQFAEAYYNRGAAKSALRRYEEAIADYDEAIRITPQYATAYYSKGIANGMLGRHEEAIADFNEAIRINPEDAAAYYNRGITQREIDKCEKARTDFQRALELATEQGNQALAQDAQKLLDEIPPASDEG